jgi:hypothetical protein
MVRASLAADWNAKMPRLNSFFMLVGRSLLEGLFAGRYATE